MWFDRDVQGAADRQPQQLRLRVGELTLAALAWGQADAPLALCLHGYPDTPWTWRHLGPRLAERGWRVVAPYSRGYAPSDLAPDGGYELGALARDVVGLHRVLGGDGRAVLIGHDWGAATAYLVAAQHPELFRRIVTLAVPPMHLLVSLARRPSRLPRELPLLIRQLRRSWYMFFQLLPGISERALPWLVPRLWQTWSPGYPAHEDARRALAALEDPARRTAALGYYRALLLPWRRQAKYAEERSWLLKAPRTPLLYLHGAIDGCMNAEVARRGADSLPAGSGFELIPEVGHFLHLEDLSRVEARIYAFFEAD
jgi:pimeloyl-ACP methyl ester carboxylesterase